MKKTRAFSYVAPLALAALLTGCAATKVPPVSVTRFNDSATGWQQPGILVKVESAANGLGDELALRGYIAAVEQELLRRGYRIADATATNAVPAGLTARVGLDRASSTERRSGPVSVGVGGGTGGYRSGVGVGLGFNLGGGSRETVNLRLTVRLDDPQTSKAVWEGRAETSIAEKAPAAQGDLAAARLAEALFRNFPGVSGETVRVD